MPYSIFSSALYKTTGLLAVLSMVTACTGISSKTPAPFDPAKISEMQFRFSKPVLFGMRLSERDIATRVSANLREWGYAISADSNGKNGYRLVAEVGEVEHAATPVGFSFSAGNSDPRALDFQKSDVLPITCVLSPGDAPDQRAELNMGFTVADYMKFSEQSGSSDKFIELLESDISTVCFNLLSELNVPTVAIEGSGKQSKPTWIPAIRLEIENDAEAEYKPAKDHTSQANEGAGASAPQAARKRIIIHNQGSPVIFKFGHERK